MTAAVGKWPTAFTHFVGHNLIAAWPETSKRASIMRQTNKVAHCQALQSAWKGSGAKPGLARYPLQH